MERILGHPRAAQLTTSSFGGSSSPSAISEWCLVVLSLTGITLGILQSDYLYVPLH